MCSVTRSRLLWDFAIAFQLIGSFTAVACDSAVCTCSSSTPIICVQRGGWHIASSDNFQVQSQQSQTEAEQVAKHCEGVRAAIAETWCGECERWNPKCQIILHRTTNDYVRAVGRGSGSTLGSSLVSPVVGAIRTRRIDLQTNVDNYLTAALPHEMCHVVLADRFRKRRAPLWFDEGVALQYDLPSKLELHERDLRQGLEKGGAIPVPALLELVDYPPPERWGVFYGQSAALVRNLLVRGTAKQLIECVESAPDGGMAAALRAKFALDPISDFSALLSADVAKRVAIKTYN